ncbi:helix-turn-helix transcriptional regulator [Stappia sp. P2PMeth1]|uniref:helix-turn-helix transcriptional regulator n=1 Tax=Stappia sp. P2PMeth1 TaxID=2003586 RepID=UPI00352EA5E5
MEPEVTDHNAKAAAARKGSPFLSTREAAFYLGLSYRTLEKMRLTDAGPRYRKHGRFVRYHIADLEAWSQGATPSCVLGEGEGE